MECSDFSLCFERPDLTKHMTTILTTISSSKRCGAIMIGSGNAATVRAGQCMGVIHLILNEGSNRATLEHAMTHGNKNLSHDGLFFFLPLPVEMHEASRLLTGLCKWEASKQTPFLYWPVSTCA